jgi:hypothetical protein
MSSIPPSSRADGNSAGKKWAQIGRAVTSPMERTDRAIVNIGPPYVVVGFEVNQTEAFTLDTINTLDYKIMKLAGVGEKHWVHHLDKDYGHAFFYVVSYGVVVKFFSFGPAGAGKIGWSNRGSRTPGEPNAWNQGAVLKDGYANSRPGTPDYGISEITKLFKISLTKDQYKRLIKETNRIREKIKKGEEKYTAYVNDTCAETARDVLDAAGISTPSGSGFVNQSGAPWVHAINPYMWHHRFKEAGYHEAIIGASKDQWKSVVEGITESEKENSSLIIEDPAIDQWHQIESRKQIQHFQ